MAVMRTALELLIFSVGSGIEHGHQACVASTFSCRAISLAHETFVSVILSNLKNPYFIVL